MLVVTERWERILEREARSSLEARLPDVLKARRWFAGKARAIQSVRIVESVPIPVGSSAVFLLFVLVEYEDGAPQLYTLPLTAAFGEQAVQIQQDLPSSIVTPLTVQTKDREHTGILYDALWNPDFTSELLSVIGQECSIHRRERRPDHLIHSGLSRLDTRRCRAGPCGLESRAEQYIRCISVIVSS